MRLAADGRQTKDIAVELGIGRVQVSRWRERYAESRRAGIERDLPRGAPPVKVDVARLVELSRRGGHLDERHRVDRGRRIPTAGTHAGRLGSVNGMVFERGQESDYDDWVHRGNHGWAYDDVLPYFKLIKRRVGPADERWRGRTGEIPVTDPPWRHPLCEAFIAGARGLGFARDLDYNTGERRVRRLLPARGRGRASGERRPRLPLSRGAPRPSCCRRQVHCFNRCEPAPHRRPVALRQ